MPWGDTQIVVEDAATADYAGMLANLAFSLVLYSGQMCTTPQDLLVPAEGIDTAFIDPFCQHRTLTLICNIQDPLTDRKSVV